jgi:AraC-like DNA-binding protein
MVQRVYRQIKKIDSEARVTIATSKTQVSSIHNQLGDNVGISVEPCRRDTFPAIALATAYLHDVLGVPEDEAVDTSDNAVKIIKHINDHLFEQLSLKEISEMFYISQSQLNRIFRRATGSPVWEYITIKRLIAARSQIQKGLPAGKVCTICGFKDYSSFYRLYKERFGVSPKQDCKKDI